MTERLDLFSRLVKLFCRKSERKDVAINFSFDLTEASRRHARFVSMITTKNWRGIKEKDEEQKARSKMATMMIITEQRSCTVAEKFQQKSFPSFSLSLSLWRSSFQLFLLPSKQRTRWKIMKRREQSYSPTEARVELWKRIHRYRQQDSRKIPAPSKQSLVRSGN